MNDIKFNDEHKASQSYFGEGVHAVEIVDVTGGTNDNGKTYFKFTVTDREAKADVKLWFSSDKAIQFSFDTIRSIFVHNAAADQKDAIRTMIDKVDGAAKLLEVCQKLKGKECWLEVTQDGEYTDMNTGEIKKSYNRNIRGYEPKPKAPVEKNEPSETKASDDGEQVMAGF